MTSILLIMMLLFVFAISSAFAIKIWSDFNSGIQGLDESTADNSTKQQINDLGQYIFWGDKLFTYLIITLILAFFITSFTLPVENSWILILFLGVLVLITFIAMFISNAWTVLLSDPSFSGVLSSLSFTDFVMRTFPYIVFFTGVTGGLIFYMRARNTGSNTSLGGGEQF